MHQVDVTQAKQRLSELIEQTIGGEEVVITKGGQPVVKLVAIGKGKRQRQFGSARGLIKISDNFNEPLEDFKEYT